MARRNLLSWAIAGALLLGVFAGREMALFAFGPAESVQAYLLWQTPLGTDAIAVRRWLASRGALLDEAGLPEVKRPVPMTINDERLDPTWVWTLDATLGSASLARSAMVTAVYTFDNRDRLVGVEVERETH